MRLIGSSQTLSRFFILENLGGGSIFSPKISLLTSFVMCDYSHYLYLTPCQDSDQKMIYYLGKCRLILTLKKKKPPGTSLVVQWLGLHDLTAKGLGSIPGQGTTISCSHETKKQNKNTPNSSFLSQKQSLLLPPSRLLETSCTTGT